MTHKIEGIDVLVVSILVFFLGNFLTQKLPFLRRYNIPAAVTGGLVCSGLVALFFAVDGTQITFDMRIRDLLLLVFFSTIGLGAKFRMLAAGGKALGLLLVVAAIFLVIQDLTGIGLAMALGAHPGYGLLGGTVSFAGGHGTAIAWGQVAEDAGLTAAKEVGIACATFGLIAGGIVGGPIAGRLIKKHKLEGRGTDGRGQGASTQKTDAPATVQGILGTVLLLVICVEVGDLVNRLLFSRGVMLPDS